MPWLVYGIDGKGEDGKVIESCAIVTTEANSLMSAIHDRMPVLLKKDEVQRWLSRQATQSELLALLAPCSNSLIITYPVSTRVNHPKNNGPECIAILS